MDARRENDIVSILFGLILLVLWVGMGWVVFSGLRDDMWGQYEGYPPYAMPPGCSFEHGGEMNACQRLMRQYPQAGEQGRVFSSFGVMALKRARCIQPNSIWRFHGAYWLFRPGQGASGPPNVAASMLMRDATARYPKLQVYLDEQGVWRSGGGPPLELNAQQMHELGVPICGH